VDHGICGLSALDPGKQGLKHGLQNPRLILELPFSA